MTLNLTWPWILLLLPFPWLLPYILPAYRKSQEPALRVPFFEALRQLPSASVNTTFFSFGMRFFSFVIWALLVLAGAGPVHLGEPIPIQEEARSMMLAVDLSGSMQLEDMREHGRVISRLETVKQFATAFLEARIGDRVGLVLFGSEVYVRAPLTFDRQTVAFLLREAQVGIAGEQTALGDAIVLALKRLKTVPGEDKVMILLTDGRNNAGTTAPLEAAQLAAQLKIKIYTIGLGRDDNEWVGPFGLRGKMIDGGPDEAALRTIAETTGGQYFRAQDPLQLKKVYERLDELEPINIEGRVLYPATPLYPFFLGAALGLSVIWVLVMIRSR